MRIGYNVLTQSTGSTEIVPSYVWPDLLRPSFLRPCADIGHVDFLLLKAMYLKAILFCDNGNAVREDDSGLMG